MDRVKAVAELPCVVVFTCRGKERMLLEGGSEAWRMDASRASKCKYVVCVQNRNETWGQASAPHKHAFLIAEISEITESQNHPGRQAIKFRKFADIDVPDSWGGNRNPVAYASLGDFGIRTEDDLNGLCWTRLGSTFYAFGAEPGLDSGDDYVAAGLEEGGADLPPTQGAALGLSFDEAKEGLALRYGFKPEQIEIVIRV